MPQDYHDQTVYRPVVIASQSPGPLSHGLLGSVPPQVLRNVALSGAIAFTVTGLAGGVWLGLQLASAKVSAAENRANDAQQRQQRAENRLSAQLDQTAKFCQAALSGKPPTPAQPQSKPVESIASQP